MIIVLADFCRTLVQHATCEAQTQISNTQNYSEGLVLWSRFGRSQIRQNAHLTSAVPVFVCTDTALVADVKPGPRFLIKRIPRMHLYLKFANHNHIGIFDVLVNGLMLATTDNPAPLPSRSPIRQILTDEAVTTGEVSCLACILANKPWEIPYEIIIYLG